MSHSFFIAFAYDEETGLKGFLVIMRYIIKEISNQKDMMIILNKG